jgi:hypothetical protein
MSSTKESLKDNYLINSSFGASKLLTKFLCLMIPAISIPSAGTLEVRVQAHNATGDSAWSPATSLSLG